VAGHANAVSLLLPSPGQVPTTGVTAVTGPISSPGQLLTGSASPSGQSLTGSASPPGQKEEEEEEDAIQLLDDQEANEFQEFGPSVSNKTMWDAGEVINTFLEKHFNHSIKPDEWDKIMSDFRSLPAQLWKSPSLTLT